MEYLFWQRTMIRQENETHSYAFYHSSMRSMRGGFILAQASNSLSKFMERPSIPVPLVHRMPVGLNDSMISKVLRNCALEIWKHSSE